MAKGKGSQERSARIKQHEEKGLFDFVEHENPHVDRNIKLQKIKWAYLKKQKDGSLPTIEAEVLRRLRQKPAGEQLRFDIHVPVGEKPAKKAAAAKKARVFASDSQMAFKDVLFMTNGLMLTAPQDLRANFQRVAEHSGKKLLSITEAFAAEESRQTKYRVKDAIAVLNNLYFFISSGGKVGISFSPEEVHTAQRLLELQRGRRAQGMLEKRKLPAENRVIMYEREQVPAKTILLIETIEAERALPEALKGEDRIKIAVLNGIFSARAIIKEIEKMRRKY